MKKIITCFSILLAGNLSAAEFEIPELLDCLSADHPSGLSLEKIKARSQFMFGDSDDLAVQVVTYLKLKKKLPEVISASTSILDTSEILLINNIMSSAASLKIKICEGFGITQDQLLILEETLCTPLADAPTLNSCLDQHSPCGLNLDTVLERERVLRLHGIADDPATFIILYRETKLEIHLTENTEKKLALTFSLHQLLKKIEASGLGLRYEQIFRIA